MIWIIDASVALRWFLEEESDPVSEQVLERVVRHPTWFVVPELFAFEVFSVLQRLHPDALKVYRFGLLPLLQGGILRHPMTEDLAAEADRFVARGLTGYDSCYAALASNLKGCWLTYDRKAHRCIQKDAVSCLLSEGLPEGWNHPS